VQMAADNLLKHLRHDGYYIERRPLCGESIEFVLDVGRSLGELYVPSDCDPKTPVIRTSPARSRLAAPFDRPEAIGWHGDFATYEDRPEFSIVYITRPDPRGGHYGAWRLASVERVLESLRTTSEGRSSFDLLKSETLPFTYSDSEAPRRFRVIENRPNGRLGLRFYLPSLRRGLIAEHGEIPSRIAVALAAVEQAADEVAEVVPTQEGSLLIASNWFALHDRVRQTISRRHPNREALLCFVAKESGREP
jgi:hypothetical protein